MVFALVKAVVGANAVDWGFVTDASAPPAQGQNAADMRLDTLLKICAEVGQSAVEKRQPCCGG
ncbi:hypothetical protein ACCQ08_21095 [Comamonas sp. SY3]|uniref:hypothetical protein n=1 Tax=Comamonas sp. SY3 TaxID=3243601 RepID=UPI0035933195